jgi:hypothetical protein
LRAVPLLTNGRAGVPLPAADPLNAHSGGADKSSCQTRADQIGLVGPSRGIGAPIPRQQQEAPVSDEIEYEEITSDEVDKVVAALEQLSATVESETIKAFLEECSTNIYYLIYDDEEEGESLAA